MRERERGRAWVLGVLETVVRGVWGELGNCGNTASAGTSSPSFRRSRSSLACSRILSGGASEWDEPALADGPLETSDGALDSTHPRWATAADSTPRWVGLRLLQVESVSSKAGTGPVAIDCDICGKAAIVKGQVEPGY